MITAKLNRPEFEYDIHALLKAFYPTENVHVSTLQKETEETITHHLEVTYGDGDITFVFYQVAETGNIEINSAQISVQSENRKNTKNELKRTLYRMLAEYTGRQLPWGNLSGIRPIKIPLALLDAGQSEAEVAAYMRDTYDTSDEKIRLSIEIAKREQALLRRLDYQNGYSLYIGIPFCPSTCLYCSFTSYPWGVWKERMDDYLDALEKEIAFTARKFANKKLNTIYIGGGTPTTLSAAQLDRLISKLEDSLDFTYLEEFTVEAGRPDSITEEKLAVLKKHNIGRISINPQTMKMETLKIIGRHHTVAQTVESFELARKLGFENINMDLIVGLPQETLDDVRSTMERLRELDPDSITVHSLALKRAARLNMFPEDYKEYKIENTSEHIELTARITAEMDMHPYYLYRQKNMAGNFENVGYAKDGKAGIYNVLIMEERQTIVALGAGAVTKFVLDENNVNRVENVKDIENYLTRVDEMIERKEKKMEEIAWH